MNIGKGTTRFLETFVVSFAAFVGTDALFTGGFTGEDAIPRAIGSLVTAVIVSFRRALATPA